MVYMKNRIVCFRREWYGWGKKKFVIIKYEYHKIEGTVCKLKIQISGFKQNSILTVQPFFRAALSIYSYKLLLDRIRFKRINSKKK